MSVRWFAVAMAVWGCAGVEEDSDDWIDNEEEAISIPGRWITSAAATAAGNRQFVRYDGAGAWNGGRSCSGSFSSGARTLGDYLQRNFRGVSSYGGYVCRQNTAAPNMLSVHGTGRAIDVFIPLSRGQADNTLGDAVANWLVSNAQSIGVQLVIWDRSSWNASRASGAKLAPYGGPHPHHDHLHIELNTDGAARRTPWFNGGPSVPPSGRSSTPTPTPSPSPGPSPTPTPTPDAGAPPPPPPPPPPPTPEPPPPPPPSGVAPQVRVFVSALNLRRGPGTSHPVIAAMPCGAPLTVVGGPSNGWYQVNYNGVTGWASGNFLLPERSFQPSVCGG
jgi:hypothetical protein